MTAARWTSFSMAETSESLRGAFVSCDYLSVHLGPMPAGRGPAAPIAPGQAASQSSSSLNAGGNGISVVTLPSSVGPSA